MSANVFYISKVTLAEFSVVIGCCFDYLFLLCLIGIRPIVLASHYSPLSESLSVLHLSNFRE